MAGPRFRLKQEIADEAENFLKDHPELRVGLKEFVQHAVVEYMRMYETMSTEELKDTVEENE